MALPLAIPVAVGLGRLAMLGYRAYQGYRAVRTAQAVTATAEAALAAERARKAAQLAQAASMAQQLAQTKAREEPCDDCPCQRTIVIPRSAAPQSAQHIEDAQRSGYPSTLTYDKNPAAARIRRRRSTAGVPRVTGQEPDEYPPAAFVENGGQASVRNIDWRDNRVAGGIIGANLVGVPAGCKITIVTGP